MKASRRDNSDADPLKAILVARVYEVAIKTDLTPAPRLSARLGNRVFLKREDQQPVFSFKIRGAHNKIANLSDAERKRGVICASAGNHAQGVALSAARLGLNAVVVMPRTTPRIKIDAVAGYGAEVVLHGDSYSEAARRCQEICDERGMVFVHPFDDPLVVAGQGTIGLEILQDRPDVDMVFVPVGGGGLISGVAHLLKALRPQCRIIGVEPEDSGAMGRSVQAGRLIRLERVGGFADGVAVKQPGEYTFRQCRDYVDDFITVSTDEMCAAIERIHGETRSIVEPSGALAVAGLAKYLPAQGLRDRVVVAINSGANMNFDRLRFVAERNQLGGGAEALYAITIPERPSALRSLVRDVVGERSLTEFHYRLATRNEAHIFVGVGLHSAAERADFEAALRRGGYVFTDLSDNDLAKSHVRYMVGGRSTDVRHEVLQVFQFPERPGALADFLDALDSRWNISLFNYRCHGSDYSQVLVGFEVSPGDRTRFDAVLEGMKNHFRCRDESANPAASLFL